MLLESPFEPLQKHPPFCPRSAQEDIRTILKWLTCSLPEAVLQEILNETDADGSGTISQREYLRCLRTRVCGIQPWDIRVKYH